MAKKEVSVLIKAKNAMAAGLSAAGASLKKFGANVTGMGKTLAKGFLVAGAALAGFGVKAVQAFSVQETAEKKAEAALSAYGDEVSGNMAKIKAFAAAIQDETGVSDENTIARAAKLRMLGVEVSALEDATKATIALQSAGMREEAAIKAVAMARNGDFEALNRYIPALRTASSESEKAQILNEFLTKGYAAQKDELDTVAGRWGALKGRVGDAMEIVGGAIAQNGALAGALDKAGEAVKRIGEKLQVWISGGGIERMIETFKLFGSNVRKTFEQIGAYAKFGIDNAWESVKWFGSAVETIFQNMGSVVKASWENMTDQAGYHLAKLHAKLTKQEWNITPPDPKDIFAGIEEIPEMVGDAAEKLDKKLAQIAKEREAREKKITKDKEEAEGKKAAAVEEAAKVEVKAEKEIALAKVDPKKAIEEEIKLAKKKMQIHAAMAKKTIADILAENKAREDAAKAREKDEQKAERLRAKVQRGVKLGKKDAKFLAAANQIAAARQGLAGAQGQVQNAQAQLALIKDQTKELGNIKDELIKMNRDLNNLLMRD